MSSRQQRKTARDKTEQRAGPLTDQQEIARFEDDLAADMLGPPPAAAQGRRQTSKTKTSPKSWDVPSSTTDDQHALLHDDALTAPMADDSFARYTEETKDFSQLSKRNQHRREEDAKGIVHDVSITALAAIKWGLLLLSYVWVVHIVSWQPWLAAESLTRIENILSHAWALIIGGLVAQVVNASKKPEPTT
jgi:hypothetical protein